MSYRCCAIPSHALPVSVATPSFRRITETVRGMSAICVPRLAGWGSGVEVSGHRGTRRATIALEVSRRERERMASGNKKLSRRERERLAQEQEHNNEEGEEDEEEDGERVRNVGTHSDDPQDMSVEASDASLDESEGRDSVTATNAPQESRAGGTWAKLYGSALPMYVFFLERIYYSDQY